MCGLVGIAGKLEWRDEATMKRLLVFDYFRGMDSTGFASLNTHSKQSKIAKIASHPLDLFESKKFVDALAGASSSVFLGHNRAATKGAVNGYNAHPFQYDHIVGAHNGTLHQSGWNRLKTLCGEETNVDSQAIFASIAKVGIEATVAEMSGAWALVWINLKDNTLNFLRNKERPLWYAYSKDFSKLFWASEYSMMDAATKMAPDAQKYDLHVDEEGYTFHRFQEDMYYRFDLDDLRKGGTYHKPTVKELKGRKEPTVGVVTNNHTASPFNRTQQGATIGGVSGSNNNGSAGTSQTTQTNQTCCTTTTSHGNHTGSDKVLAVHNNQGAGGTGKVEDIEYVHLQGSMKDPWAGMLTEGRFQEAAKHGCQWCGGPAFHHDIGTTFFEADNTVMCATCTGEDNRNTFVATHRATLHAIARRGAA